MKSGKKTPKITPIDWVDDSDRWIVVPGTVLEKKRKRVKGIAHVKKNCLYATGVPRGMYDFIYRAVKNLKLDGRTFIFSRGMVRTPRTRLKYSVSVKELDWGVGTLVTIPRLLRYREMITLIIEEKEYTMRLMDLVVLRGLLMLAVPGKPREFYPVKAAVILARGWKELHCAEIPSVYKK